MDATKFDVKGRWPNDAGWFGRVVPNGVDRNHISVIIVAEYEARQRTRGTILPAIPPIRLTTCVAVLVALTAFAILAAALLFLAHPVLFWTTLAIVVTANMDRRTCRKRSRSADA